MAFTIRDLSVLAYANGFTLWHYKSGNDSLADVGRDDYFSDAADMMASGDIVLISNAQSARVLCLTQSDAGAVRSAPVS